MEELPISDYPPDPIILQDEYLTSLCFLSDDCLLEIFSYLTWKDKLNLSRINSRFAYLCYILCKNLTLGCERNFNNIQEYLMRFGNRIENFQIMLNRINNPIVLLLPKYCRKLKSLSINFLGCYIDANGVERILSKLKDLEVLTLNDIELSPDVYRKISKLKKLRRFVIIYSDEIYVRELAKIKTLTELCIICCKITTYEFNYLFKKKRFKELTLKCMFINDAMPSIFAYQTDLEVLDVSIDAHGCRHWKRIRNLKKLKIAKFHFDERIDLRFLSYFLGCFQHTIKEVFIRHNHLSYMDSFYLWAVKRNYRNFELDYYSGSGILIFKRMS